MLSLHLVCFLYTLALVNLRLYDFIIRVFNRCYFRDMLIIFQVKIRYSVISRSVL